MRKLNQPSGDSLELLLDTLCNVFGGIILVACLLALLAREQNGPPVPILTGSEGLLLERRIEAAQDEVRGLKELITKLTDAGAGERQELAAERDQLRKTLETLRDEKSERLRVAGELEANDPISVLVQLRAKVKQAQQRIADAEARGEAGQAKEKALLARLQDLTAETREVQEGQVQLLRFPKEKQPTKTAFYIILSRDQVFPLRDANDSVFSGLQHDVLPDDDFRVKPKIGMGFSPASDAGEVRGILERCRRNGSYVTLMVYADSFEAFRTTKDMIMAAGLDYGLKVVPEGRELTFGTGGTSPPPL